MGSNPTPSSDKTNTMEKPLKDMTKEEFLEFVEKQRTEAAAQAQERHIKLWNNLPKLESVDKIPALPQVEDPDEWKNFYIVKLIEAGAIPKSLLKDREYYIGDHRRARVAQWLADENRFVYMREKFGHRFKDKCNHFEDDDGFALFVPIATATVEQFEKNAI